MKTKLKYKDKYLPVDPDFIEIVEEVASMKQIGKVHFFDPDDQVQTHEGFLTSWLADSDGEFALLENHAIRADKIITLFGKPGPSYEAYDRFANACLTCENLGQF